MDEAFGILMLIGVGALLLFGPWILLWRSHRKRIRQREEDQTRWAELTRRVHVLEQSIQSSASFEIPKPVSAPVAVTAPAPRIRSPYVQQPPQPTWVEPPPLASMPFEPPATPEEMPTAPRKASSRLKSALDVEDKLGANWLNKLGIGLLVLGIAFFLAYQLTNLGPAGKVLVGYVVSAAMLAIGIWLERKDRYRILARAGVGGGWALLFFTTFAMYHVPAAHVLNSQLVDLFLLLVIAAVMVVHTLHYRSQVVTGLAFVLGFLTVGVSHSDLYSLGAGAVLVAGLVVIVVRMKWYELEVFGMLASYLNHYLWLRPIVEPMKGYRHPFAEFPASAGLLLLYWAIFRVSYLWRQPDNQRQERISTIAALLNTLLLLLLFKYQSTHPEWSFWALLAIGAVETGLGQFAAKNRRTAVVVLTTLGVVLLIAAFPFYHSELRLSVFWLLEAEALLLIGVWTGEIVFRRLGTVTSLLAAGQMLSTDAAIIAGIRMDDANISPQWRLAAFFAVAACVFYANAHWIFRRWSALFTHQVDRRLMVQLSYVGGVMAGIALWLAFPEAWTALAWSGLGLLLILVGRKLLIADLRFQGNLLAAVCVLRSFSINLKTTTSFHGMSQRAITLSLTAIVLYLTSRWSGEATASELKVERSLQWVLQDGLYTWSASLLLGLLAWYELRPIGVAVAWAMGGLLLLEAGLNRKSLSLRLQAYAGLLAAFLRMFLVNLNGHGAPGELSPRFYTVIPVACAFFYSYCRLRENRQGLARIEHALAVVSTCCWMGTISIASLMRFELEADWVAAAWAALAFGLVAVAWRSSQRVFLYQALLLVFALMFRVSLHNFYERSYFPPATWLTTRWTTVGTALLLLLAALPLLFKFRQTTGIGSQSRILRVFQAIASRPEQVFFFVALELLTVLLAIEMRHGMVTLSWGVEALVVFVFALWVGERSFRLAGLGLLLLSAAKILVLDVWRLNPSDRYLTLIVLGAALLSVSFLYTRYREAIRQYL